MSKSRGRRKKKHVEEESHADSERWLVSYSDMLTVLVGLFIVLYAISQVDQDKFNALAASLNAGFGGSGTSVMENGSSIMVEQGAVAPVISPLDATNLATALRNDNTQDHLGESTEEAIDPADLQAARIEYEALAGLAEKLDNKLAKKGLDGLVSYKIDERGLVIGLVSDELFFVADTAQLTDESREVVDTLTPVLDKVPNELSIEGHANNIPSSRYGSNWELSSDRATQVLRRFVEFGKIDPARAAAVGYGDARPLKSNTSEEGLRTNRRVDIVVLSNQPERVRELIPRVLAEHQAEFDALNEASTAREESSSKDSEKP